MTDEPSKKRQKSGDSDDIILLSASNHEDEGEENQLDKQIENEEKNADNLVIKDLMGSVKPESNKVFQKNFFLKINYLFI
jgi:hypothetical protein